MLNTAKPAKAFAEAGHSLLHVGLKKNNTVKGKRDIATVKIDESFSDVKPDNFDAILIPGGCSPDNLRGEREPVEFIKEFDRSKRPIFAICHAPQLLITAELVEGRKITGWKSIVQDIKNAGAEYIDNEVVEDNNIITSRGPGYSSIYRSFFEKIRIKIPFI